MFILDMSELQIIQYKEECLELVEKSFFDEEITKYINKNKEKEINSQIKKIDIQELKKIFNRGYNPNAFDGRFFKMLIFNCEPIELLLHLFPYMDDNTKAEIYNFPIYYNPSKSRNNLIEIIALLSERNMIKDYYLKPILLDYVKDYSFIGFHNYKKVKNIIEAALYKKKIQIKIEEVESFLIAILIELTYFHSNKLLEIKKDHKIIDDFYELISYIASLIPNGYFEENKEIKKKYKKIIVKAKELDNVILEEALRNNDYSESYFTFFESD